MDLYKFSFAVLTAANVGVGLLQYRTRNHTARSRANSSPRSPRSSPRKLSQDLGNSRSSSNASKGSRGDGSLFSNPFAMANTATLIDEEKMLLNRPITPSWSHVAERDREAAWEFQKTFFAVHILVMAADWLQGPYLYTLYKDEKQLSERTVALLFVAGFVSAAVSASFVGGLADTHGRKRACLVFCAMYSCSCLTMVSDSALVLFTGRILGGISSTLLYSCFETWMVHEFHARNMAACGMVLSKMLGLMTTVSSIVAILAGVIGQIGVNQSETKKTPFMLAILCLITAAWLITTRWTENHGTSDTTTAEPNSTDIKSILQDKKILSLGIVSCIFEGSMYLFIFFWSSAVKASRENQADINTTTDTSTSTPFGLVFATFMSAMMFGSQLFTVATSASVQPQVNHYTQTLTATIITSALALCLLSALSSHTRKLELMFWSLCLFEAMVGIYFPTMGYLKVQFIPDGMRARVYGLFRLPLNVFVVVILALVKEGDRYRDGVFLACGGLLIFAYVICQKALI